MKSTTACGLLLAITIAMSCNQSSEKSKANDQALNSVISEVKMEEQQIPVQDNPDIANTDSIAGPVIPANPTSVAATPNIDWDKKVIKNATVKYEVNNFDQFNTAMRERVRKFGGYIAQEDNLQYEDRKEIALIIKVPVAQFEPMMNDISGKDVKQVERTIKTEDVTGQVIDTKSRLEAKKEMRQKYLEFLRQSKNMEEVLKVQAEINAIQEEIESAAGRIQYLTKSAAYSTINLSFYQPMDGFKAPADDNSFWNKTGQAFSRGGEMIKGLWLVIISIWPLVLVGLVGLIIWKRRKSHQTVTATQG
ncbi:MAG: DUF4349 domain-containing protein [Chitinophagaceae bacterium]|nr:MAG: DUF4349 domain-containing protein [Chitinophagaceae bacterium]